MSRALSISQIGPMQRSLGIAILLLGAPSLAVAAPPAASCELYSIQKAALDLHCAGLGDADLLRGCARFTNRLAACQSPNDESLPKHKGEPGDQYNHQRDPRDPGYRFVLELSAPDDDWNQWRVLRLAREHYDPPPTLDGAANGSDRRGGGMMRARRRSGSPTHSQHNQYQHRRHRALAPLTRPRSRRRARAAGLRLQ